MLNAELFRLIVKYNLGLAFAVLIVLSVFTTASIILSAHLVAEVLTNLSSVSTNTFFVFGFYLLANFLTLLLEFLTQKLTADLAGAMGSEYIKNLVYDRENEENIQSELAAKLTTQIERFRAENMQPAFSLIVRSIIVLGGACYIIFIVDRSILFVMALSVCLFAASYLLIISRLAAFIDHKLSQTLFELGAIVERIIKARSIIFFSDVKNIIGKNFQREYRQYGLSRGMNGALNLFPRQLIEVIVIGVVVYDYYTESLSIFKTLEGGNLVLLSLILYKLYPQITILVKNITTIMMTRTAFPIEFSNNKGVSRMTFDSNFYFEDLHWDFRKNRILLITGESGCGKSSLAKEIAKEFNRRGLNVGFIDSNGFVPLSISDLKKEFSSETFEQLKRELGVSLLETDPSVWSNGQRQRLLIVMCLEMGVDAIVLDEGLAALGKKDLDIALNLLKRTNMPLILISHHIDFVARFPEAQIYSM